MENKIEMDETKALEIQTASVSIANEAEGAILELEQATKQKQFGPDSEFSLAAVESYGKKLAGQITAWDAFIGPVVKTAKDLHTMLVARRDAIRDPLDAKKKRAALAVGAFRWAHDADRREREAAEQRRLQKIEEDKRIAEAAALEKSGAKEEANQLIEEPVYTPPVTYAAPAKQDGVGQRGTWKFKVTDETKIPDRFWIVNESLIGAEVRAHKNTAKAEAAIPGVSVWFEPSASFSSK